MLQELPFNVNSSEGAEAFDRPLSLLRTMKSKYKVASVEGPFANLLLLTHCVAWHSPEDGSVQRVSQTLGFTPLRYGSIHRIVNDAASITKRFHRRHGPC